MKDVLLISSLLLASCGNKENKYDASGTFEAVEIIVSAEGTGLIKEFGISEGQQLKEGETIGYIDSVQLFLKKKQLLSQIKAVLSRSPNISSQVAAMEEQIKQAKNEQQRITNLLKAGASTQKQLDDVNTQVLVLTKQMDATRSSLGITASGISEETSPLSVQIEQINDQLAKCKIINPIKGTVLVKYAEKNEMTAIGKPLYKIAELSSLTLRGYITGDQLASVKTGQQVTVLVDSGKETYKQYKGTVEWISDKAEFTPKTIQTKDERANLVYALKINVANDGMLKIGMYGEIKLND